MRVGDCLASRNKGCKQMVLVHRHIFTGVQAFVILVDSIDQSSFTNKTHGIKRLTSARICSELIQGHNTGMFKVPGDLRFAMKPLPCARTLGRINIHFLDGHHSFQLFVPRQPDCTQPAFAQPSHKRKFRSHSATAVACDTVSGQRIAVIANGCYQAGSHLAAARSAMPNLFMCQGTS